MPCCPNLLTFYVLQTTLGKMFIWTEAIMVCLEVQSKMPWMCWIQVGSQVQGAECLHAAPLYLPRPPNTTAEGILCPFSPLAE